MTDEHVDELLADLDRALGVEPSPSVSANVRMRIDRAPAVRWGRSWLPVAATVVVIVAVGALLWRGPSEAQRLAPAVAAKPAAESVGHSLAPDPSPIPLRSGRTTEAAAPRRARVRSAMTQRVSLEAREPEVIVSADRRIALEQLRAGLRDGRISEDVLVSGTTSESLGPLTITPVIVAPFKADVVTWPDDEGRVGRMGGVIRRN